MSFSPIGQKSKSQRHSSGIISVVVVPEGGVPRRYNVKTIWLKIAGVTAGIFVLVFVFAVISYTSLLTKALERDHLLSENARLQSENQRIARLAKDVEESRQSLSRIVKSLGGKLELSQSSGQDSL